MKVAIVKYNAGNIFSVVNTLRRIGIEPVLTDEAETLKLADRILFPGQGEARGAMDYLRQRKLDVLIRDLRQPVLGICVGQQLLCRHTEEGDTTCIGIFDADVRRFRPQHHNDKVPCMGWNSLYDLKTPLFDNLPAPTTPNDQSAEIRPYVYFVHSYYVPLCSETIATTNHILPYSAALRRDNYFATQFHPEKSGDVGEQIIRNFLDIEIQ